VLQENLGFGLSIKIGSISVSTLTSKGGLRDNEDANDNERKDAKIKVCSVLALSEILFNLAGIIISQIKKDNTLI
jgi:hypothetical protein